MKKRISIASISLSMLILFNSCGVMFGGSQYEGTITAKDHPNAEIIINGEKKGNGSVTGLYPRDKSLVVEIKEDGCETKTQTFGNTLRTGNLILSAFSWGLIGLIVDLASGASYKPEHKKNTAVEKVDDKKYNFNVEPLDCKKK